MESILASGSFGFADDYPATSIGGIFKLTADDLPSPGGEGKGEVESPPGRGKSGTPELMKGIVGGQTEAFVSLRPLRLCAKMKKSPLPPAERLSAQRKKRTAPLRLWIG
jgi:hypothetical protein